MLNKLEIYNFEDTGRGMRATENIFTGDIIAKIPLSNCIIVDNNTKKPDDIRISHENWSNMDLFEKLATVLILENEKGMQSRYYNYIQTFPSNLNLVDTMNNLRWDKYWLKFKRKLDNELRLMKFKWCNKVKAKYFLDIARTRSIYNPHRCGLYPMLDLFNHDTRTTKDFDYDLKIENNYIIFRSMRNVIRHQQFFVSYGKLSSNDLLYQYGIIT